MKALYPSIGLERLCRLFGKSRQAYYDHYKREQNRTSYEALILYMIRQIRKDMPRIGGIKLHQMLTSQKSELTIGRDRFFTLLREHGLLVKRKRKHVRTTFSNHGYYKWPDLTTTLDLRAKEQLWVSDITYLKTSQGFVYLSLISDAYSKKIVGFHLSQYLKVQGCLIALEKAINSLSKGTSDLIHHSDRGIQYCCQDYVNRLQKHHIKISMTQNGSPYENAIAERVNGILKNELGLNQTFLSYHHAIGPTHKAIDIYNRLRPHLSCGFLTPDMAHITQNPVTKIWKRKPFSVKTAYM